MILVDTSVIIPWLDGSHSQHRRCKDALVRAFATNSPAVSSVTFAELAAGMRNREDVEMVLQGFEWLELDFPSAWRAGVAFRRYKPSSGDKPVLPDFLIRAQCAVHNLPHLTNDRRRTRAFPDVDFEFVA